jgi:hypothetical protein
LRSKAPTAFQLFYQDRAQSLPDLLNDCSAVFGVNVVHNEASFGQESASIGTHPSRLRARLAILNGTGDRRFWLSARALVFENSGLQ